jgi:hypothetical protein
MTCGLIFRKGTEMTQLNGQLGELAMTVQVTRAATGKVEEVKLTSAITDPKTHEQLLKELPDGSHTQHSE